MKAQHTKRPTEINVVRCTALGRPASRLSTYHSFTLIELLVVMAIIAILMAISGTMIANYLTRAREAATATTIEKMDRLIQQRKEAVERHYQFGTYQSRLTDYRGVLQKKAAVRGALPQRLEDLFGMDGAPGKKDVNDDAKQDNYDEVVGTDAAGNLYDLGELGAPGSDDPPAAAVFRQVLQEAGYITNGPFPANAPKFYAAHKRNSESAELLYVVVTRAEAYGVAPVDQDAFSTREYADTDGDGLNEFVDAWGEPLRFYRWPTRLLKPDGAAGPDGIAGQPGIDDNNNNTVDDVGELGLGGDDQPNRAVASLLITGLPAAPPTGSGELDPLNEDPDDPLNSLSGLAKTYVKSGMTVDQASRRVEAKWHTLVTYHVPLVVSSGVDRELGLYEPYDVDVAAGRFGNLAQPTPPVLADPGNSALNDNITNGNRRAGGK